MLTWVIETPKLLARNSVLSKYFWYQIAVRAILLEDRVLEMSFFQSYWIRLCLWFVLFFGVGAGLTSVGVPTVLTYFLVLIGAFITSRSKKLRRWMYGPNSN